MTQVSKQIEKTRVIPAEFARIVGVTRQRVDKKLKSAQFSGVVGADGMIEVFGGVLLWFQTKDLSKERGDKTEGLNDDLMDRLKSAQFKEHYSALREKAAYDADMKLLVELAPVIRHFYGLGLKVQRGLLAVPKSTKAVSTIEARIILEEDITKAFRPMIHSDYYRTKEVVV